MAHNEAPEKKFNVEMIEFSNKGEADVTPSLSGSMFLSGGSLHFVGSAGTLTQIALQ